MKDTHLEYQARLDIQVVYTSASFVRHLPVGFTSLK